MRSARPKAAVDLPLPVPVWTISRPFSIGLARDLGVLHRLALRHLGAVALGFASSSRHLHGHRQAGDHEQHAVGPRRKALVEPPWPRRETRGRAHCRARCRGRPRSRRARSAPRGGQRGFERVASRVDSRAPPSMRLDSHSVRQSTSAGCSATRHERFGKSRGASTVCHRRRGGRDARRCGRHLVVARLGGRDIDPRRRQRGDQRLRVAALARARAAEDQSQGPNFVIASGAKQSSAPGQWIASSLRSSQ